MKLIQLEYFCEICNQNFNISKAAQILHVSQPAVSKAIKELEAEFNITLFTRNNKRLFLTEEGKIFLSSARNIINNMTALKTQMDDIHKQKNTIHIGLSSILSTFKISSLLKNFKQAYPHINFDIESNGTIQLINNLDNLDIDFVIGNIHKNINYTDKNINVVPIYKTELLFCTSPNNKLAENKFVTYKMLEKEPLVLTKNHGENDTIIKKRFINMGLNPNIILYLEQTDAIKSFVKSGYASSIFFSDMIENEPNIKGIPFDEKEIANVGLFYAKNHYISINEQNFIDFAVNYFK